MEPIHLGVNVDHVATLRQARGTRYPDPVTAALIAEHAGADSITVHLREDRRHIQARDVELLLRTVQTRVNLEMAVTESMLELAVRHRPADCCFVPERRQELTTEGGLDVVGQAAKIAAACRRGNSRSWRWATTIRWPAMPPQSAKPRTAGSRSSSIRTRSTDELATAANLRLAGWGSAGSRGDWH